MSTKEEKAQSFAPIAVPAIMSVLSLIWAAVSIGEVLGGTGLGYSVALVYDLFWGYSIFVSWFKPDVPNKWVIGVGWGAMALSMLFIALHGIFMEAGETVRVLDFEVLKVSTEQDAWLLGLGGAIVPLLAKGSWALADHYVHTPDLSAMTPEMKKELAEDERQTNFEIEKAALEKKAQSQKRISDIKTNADIKIEEILAAHRVAEAQEQANRSLSGTGYKLVREDQVIQGQVIPQAEGSQQRALSAAPQAASSSRPNMLTVSLGKGEAEEPLTEAQEARKRLAALFYLYEDEAAERKQKLTQTAYADMMKTNKVMVSRCCKEFPRESIKDFTVYVEEMEQTG